MLQYIKSQRQTLRGKRFWLMVIDAATKHKWSFFLRNKLDLSKVMIQFLADLIGRGYDVKQLQCDNAGENKALMNKIKNKKWGIDFEFTAPNTPQQNDIIECAFATIYGKAQAMMCDANFPDAERELLWAEAVHTCTQIDNILTNNEGKSATELFRGQKPTLARYLRVFGEACVFANREKIKSKLQDCGEVGMFLGYSLLHDNNTYRIYKPSTKHVVLS